MVLSALVTILALSGLIMTKSATVRSAAAQVHGPVTSRAAAFAESDPFSNIRINKAAEPNAPGNFRFAGTEDIPRFAARTDSTPLIFSDVPARTARFSITPMPLPSLAFDGIANYDNVSEYNLLIMPPDMNGDVGPGHYVQVANSLFRVYNKQGSPITPPMRLSSLFSSLGTVCSTRNDGLPVVLYDPLADRWLISQLCTAFPPFRQMIAVSKTGDPAGEYYAYEFVMPNVRINDFPKLGVWTDGYYMSTDEFFGSDYAGSGMFAFDREKMLAGDPTAGYIYFNTPTSIPIRRKGMLPADIDGLTAPPNGAKALFATYTATEYGDASDSIRLFEFVPDFAEPANSTFTEAGYSPIAVAAFDPTSPDGRADIAQPPPGDFLDSQSDRLNFRLAYRNFGSHESLTFNQTVRLTPVGSTYRAGVRVYEFRRIGTEFVPAVQSTIGSTDVSRWVGSVAQDHQGNIGVQYNSVNEEKRPAIVFSGRLAGDAADTFRSERSLIDGTGVQKAFGWRWGEYSGMSVDPVDDCTFWLTNSYYSLASEQWSEMGWLTHIGSFKFDECVPAPRGKLRAELRNSVTNAPVENGTVRVYPSLDVSNTPHFRMSRSDGTTAVMIIPPTQYRVAASATGYRSKTTDINVQNDLDTVSVARFNLDPVPLIEISGTTVVSESCRIDRAPEPGEELTINVTLRNAGLAAAVNVTATLLTGGGISVSGPPRNYGTIPPNGSVTRSFAATIDANAKCGSQISPSVRLNSNDEQLGDMSFDLRVGQQIVAFSENFDGVAAPALPSGWSTATSENHQLWRTSEARQQSGSNAAFSPAPIQKGVNELTSPVLHINSASAVLKFRNWYELETTFLRNRLYDGSVLEIKIGESAWQDIVSAGGRFISGGYDGTIDGCCSNPLAGRLGWSGRSGVNRVSEFVDTVAQLPPAAAGHDVRLRWRVGTDIGGFREGQYIDNIVVTDGYSCECNRPSGANAPFDFDGDGRTDIGVANLSDQQGIADFRVIESFTGSEILTSFGSVGDIPAVSDHDGDGRADIAIFRPTTGEWWIRNSGDKSIRTLRYGSEGDRPFPADFDGDGTSDQAVYRAQTGEWQILRSSNSQPLTIRFGVDSDIPVPDDFDGDGRADVAVFRPGSGEWFILRSVDSEVSILRFGLSEDLPVPADYDGDGKADIAVFRPSTGIWHLLRSKLGLISYQFGLSGDRPLRSDIDGDGKADIGVFRPATGVWYWLQSSNSAPFVRQFGSVSDQPIPAIFIRD